MKYSVAEGVATSACEGATKEYYIPYALAAGASVSVVGWLVALAQLALAFAYLKVPTFVRVMNSRKRAILVTVFFDVFTFLPFIVLPIFVKDHLIQTIFFFYVVSIVPTIVVGPIWASWITDLVPAGVRGRYLGLRSTLMGSSELALFIIAGIILNYFASSVFIGFSIIFGFAAAARLAAWFMYWKMRDIPLASPDEVSHFGMADIRQAVRNGSVGRFMVFSAALCFAVYLAHPFYAVFMLERLHFTYLEFMLVICADQAARLFILRFWGKFADRRGSLRVVRLVSGFIPFAPLLWLISQNLVFLIIVQLLSGLAWAGFELCAPNFIYSVAPAGNRIKYIALYRSLNGMAMAMGALVGGYLAVYLPAIGGHHILTLLLISGIARAAVVLKLLPPIIDTIFKRNVQAARFHHLRGMLAGDTVSDGFGWGMFHIPEEARRGVSRAFIMTKQEPVPDIKAKSEALFYNEAWRSLKRFKPATLGEPTAFVEERERLKREGLAHRIRAQQVEAKKKAAGSSPAPSGGSNGYSDRAAYIQQAIRPSTPADTRTAGGDNAVSWSGERSSPPTGTLDHDHVTITPMRSLPRAAGSDGSEYNAPVRRGVIEALRRGWTGVREALSEAEAGVRRYREGLLHDSRARESYLVKKLEKPEKTNGGTTGSPGMGKGLIHHSEVWKLYQVTGKNSPTDPSGRLETASQAGPGLLRNPDTTRRGGQEQKSRQSVKPGKSSPPGRGMLHDAGAARKLNTEKKAERPKNRVKKDRPGLPGQLGSEIKRIPVDKPDDRAK